MVLDPPPPRRKRIIFENISFEKCPLKRMKKKNMYLLILFLEDKEDFFCINYPPPGKNKEKNICLLILFSKNKEEEEYQ